jgi:hypothetical protein
MKLLTPLFAILFILFASGNNVAAKEWRGIVPLHSTRPDVESSLGSATKSTAFGNYYSLPNEIVVVWFQNDSCDTTVGKFGVGWNVPQGTVTSIGIIPKQVYRKERFFQGNDFKVEDINAGFVYYTNETDGLSVETLNGIVTLLTYSPTAKEDHLRCPRVEKCCMDVFPTFDEYAGLNFEDEKARLDSFVIKMNEQLGRGAIVVYGESRAVRNMIMKRAARARRYLREKGGLESQRLLIIDGGYKDRSITQLHLYTIGGEVSRILLFPEKDPGQAAPNKLLHLTP